MSDPILDVIGLRKQFGAVPVLDDVTFSVRRGEKVAVIGPSGSGKTTMLRCLNFLEMPSGGRIVIDGKPFGRVERRGREVVETDKALADRRAEIGFVFQRFNLFGHLTALQNVALAPRLVRGLPEAEARRLAGEMLERVGLSHRVDALPEMLSGGQQQRVAIARVMAMRPKLILFDEPTSALDPELVGEVLAVMRDLARQGMTMLIVTHEIRFAAEVADRILFMDKGRIALDGTPREVLVDGTTDRVRQFLRSMHADLTLPTEAGRPGA